MKFDCILFDFDGVIADTDKARYDILKQILIKYNIYIDNSYLKKLIGFSTKSFLRQNFPKLNNLEIENIIAERHQIYFSDLLNYCIPFEGMTNTIQELSNQSKLAIVTTNSYEIVYRQLEYLSINKCFQWVIGRESTEDENLSKTYSKVSEIINCYPEKCIVIEDSEIGLNAAKSEGYYCIKFSPIETKNTSHCNYDDFVKNYSELKSKIKRLL